MDAEQQQRVIELVRELPWADLDGAICGFEECPRLAFDATRDALATAVVRNGYKPPTRQLALTGTSRTRAPHFSLPLSARPSDVGRRPFRERRLTLTR